MKENKIAKSSLLIQKEKELKDLQKKKVQLIKNIKTTKTKIADLQTEIDSIGKNMTNGIARMAELGQLAKDIRKTLKELKKAVKLSKNDKEELKMVVEQGVLSDIEETVDDMFEASPFGSAEGFANRFDDIDENEYADEFSRQRRAAMFDPFMVKPTEEEQQKIRKVYVGLAARFHPDKADGEAELKLFNDLMQSINSAYQRGDLDELLDIQTRFADYKTDDMANSGYDIPVLDVLDEHILKHRNDLALLESQMLRLKTELQNLKDSDLGAMAKQEKRAKGQGSSEDLANGSQFMYEFLEVVKNILEQWVETKKKPMAFNQLVDGSHPIILKGQEGGFLGGAGFDDFELDYDEDDLDMMDLSHLSEKEVMELMGFLSAMGGGPQPRGGGKKRRR